MSAPPLAAIWAVHFCGRHGRLCGHSSKPTRRSTHHTGATVSAACSSHLSPSDHDHLAELTFRSLPLPTLLFPPQDSRPFSQASASPLSLASVRTSPAGGAQRRRTGAGSRGRCIEERALQEGCKAADLCLLGFALNSGDSHPHLWIACGQRGRTEAASAIAPV